MNLYTFHGQKVHSVLRDMFYQVICYLILIFVIFQCLMFHCWSKLVWRPRPPSLLSHTTEQHIQANLDVILKKKQKMFEKYLIFFFFYI